MLPVGSESRQEAKMQDAPGAPVADNSPTGGMNPYNSARSALQELGRPPNTLEFCALSSCAKLQKKIWVGPLEVPPSHKVGLKT